MKKLLTVLLLSLAFISHSQAQNAHEKLNDLLYKADMLDLYKVYPQAKDSILPEFDLMCKIHIAAAYNQPGKACNLISELSRDYPAYLGPVLLNLIAEQLYIVGEYKTAADILNEVIPQLKVQNRPVERLNKTLRINQALYKEKKISIIGEENIIPIKREKNNTYIYSDAVLNGAKANAFYNLCGETVVEENFANKNGVKFLADSMPMTGNSKVMSYCKLGIIDSLQIGSFKCYNVPCYIIPGSQQIVKNDILIGLDLLRHFSELKIYPQKNEFMLSRKHAEAPSPIHNFMIWDKRSYLECMYGNERQIFTLDMSDNHEGIYQPEYFDLCKGRFIDLNTPKMASTLKIYQLKPFDLKFGETIKTMTDFFTFENKNTDVISDTKPAIGNIGVNFINHCNEFIINFSNMYYEIK